MCASCAWRSSSRFRRSLRARASIARCCIKDGAATDRPSQTSLCGAVPSTSRAEDRPHPGPRQRHANLPVGAQYDAVAHAAHATPPSIRDGRPADASVHSRRPSSSTPPPPTLPFRPCRRCLPIRLSIVCNAASRRSIAPFASARLARFAHRCRRRRRGRLLRPTRRGGLARPACCRFVSLQRARSYSTTTTNLLFCKASTCTSSGIAMATAPRSTAAPLLSTSRTFVACARSKRRALCRTAVARLGQGVRRPRMLDGGRFQGPSRSDLPAIH